MRANFEAEPAVIGVVAFSSDHSKQNDHYEIIERCLRSVVENTDSARYRLHIGCNNLSPRAIRLVDDLRAEGLATKHMGEPRTDVNGAAVFPKYPLMRAIYSATRSPWVVWLDDDSYICKPDWLERLEEAINNISWADQFGKLAAAPMANPGPGWIEEAVWFDPGWEPRWLDLGGGERQLYCEYIVGGFYALSR